MDKEWLSINGLAAATGIPESTTRRYIRTYGRYLSSTRARGRFKRYAAASVPILEQISGWYKAGKERPEIERELQATQPITVEPVEEAAGEMEIARPISAQALMQYLADDKKEKEKLLADFRVQLDHLMELLEDLRRPWWKRLSGKKETSR